jgi:hypothetical protein
LSAEARLSPAPVENAAAGAGASIAKPATTRAAAALVANVFMVSSPESIINVSLTCAMTQRLPSPSLRKSKSAIFLLPLREKVSIA